MGKGGKGRETLRYWQAFAQSCYGGKEGGVSRMDCKVGEDGYVTGEWLWLL
jgi:hypothetical protein